MKPQRRLRLVTLGIGVGTIVVAAVWAWGGIDETVFTSGSPDRYDTERADDTSVNPRTPSIDPADFDTELWRVPPEPPVRSTPTPLSRLELLGITSREGQPAAMIFDPETDMMVVLVEGESHGPTAVIEIKQDAVVCSAHGRSFTLEFEEYAP